MRRLATIALLAVVVAGCGDDDSGDVAPTTAPTATTAPSPTGTSPTTGGATTTVTIDAADCAPATVSSPATFDGSGFGVYATLLTSVDTAGRTVGFDIVQWLVGEEAVAAYEVETGDPGGPPNDYMVVNENEQVREAPVAEDVLVRLVRLSEDSDADLDDAAFEELETYAATTPSIYWLTIDAGTVVAVCEQFVP